MRSLRLSLLLLIALALPAAAGVPIEHWRSSTGTRVYFVASPALPILDVQIDFAAGSAFDPPGQSGLAALTRGVLDLGAGDRDENAIADQLADLGARLAGGADTDRASVSLRTLSAPDKRGPALTLLAEILRAPRFDAAVFARQQANTVAALKDALTRPGTLAGRAFWQALYPQHPYGAQPTPESLAALRPDDLRAFHARYYVAANATLTLVGAISRAEAETIAEQLCAGLPRGEAAALPPPPALPAAKTTRIAHPASQSHLYLGLPAIPRGHPDTFALLVGNYSFGGGGFVSRLMKEIRDKRGYAYSVYSHFSPLRQTGPFQIALQTKRAQAGDALRLSQTLLEQFLRSGPSDEELAAAKAYLTGSFPLRLDSNAKLLENVASIAFYGLPLDYLDQYRERIAAVTAADVRRAFAAWVRPEHLVTVIVAGD